MELVFMHRTGQGIHAYKTPRPMIQMSEALVRALICTFHSMGMGRMAKKMSVRMLTTWCQRQ